MSSLFRIVHDRLHLQDIRGLVRSAAIAKRHGPNAI